MANIEKECHRYTKLCLDSDLVGTIADIRKRSNVLSGSILWNLDAESAGKNVDYHLKEEERCDNNGSLSMETQEVAAVRSGLLSSGKITRKRHAQVGFEGRSWYKKRKLDSKFHPHMVGCQGQVGK